MEGLTDTPQKFKRSARLLSKKIKSLGLVESSLKSEDVLFINSLTAKDVREIGGKCGFLFNNTEDLVLSKIKMMECNKSNGNRSIYNHTSVN